MQSLVFVFLAFVGIYCRCGRSAPVTPVNFSKATSIWVDEEDVTVTVENAQRVGDGENDWQTLTTWRSADGRGNHLELFRADLQRRYAVLGFDLPGEKCLVWQFPEGFIHKATWIMW